MNPLFVATMELQRPSGTIISAGGDAYCHASPIPRDVCPHCKCETQPYSVVCDDHPFSTHHCPNHGDVVPMRSAVSNPG